MATTCKECGFKIRGSNHESGPHHRNNRESVSGARAARRAKAHRRHGIKTNIGDPRQDLSAGQWAMWIKGFYPGEKE